ncbi:MAG: hypothetical protein JNL08_15115 [Planctomycetes bacterium]|nr:hypothetical protein [Planctomycetota bacterium]
MSAGDKAQQGGNDGFRAAVAQWRLNLRTEVKKSSSLPSAMFDACDPMLETRLAESAEAMLACLQEPEDRLRDPGDSTEKRLERVADDELRRLPARIASIEVVPLHLRTGLLAEYLGILTDTACVANGPAQHGAVQLLQRDFGVDADSDPSQLGTLLTQQVQDSLANCPDACEATAEQIAVACQRLGAALLLHAPGPTTAPGAPR